MIKRILPIAGMEDLEMTEVASRPWRHGRHVTFVVALDGTHWSFEIPVHRDDGWQTGADVVATQVRQVDHTANVKIWEVVG